MEAHERLLVLEQFRTTHDRLLGLVEGLTPAQWGFRPGEGQWTIHEVLEHVTAVERRITGAIQKYLGAAGDPAKLAQTTGKDAMLLRVMPTRDDRVQAPEPVLPNGRWPVPSELVDAFRTTRAKTIEFVESAPGGLRDLSFPHAYFGELDGYQWLITLAGHAERHAKQIEEVRQHPAFPAA